MSQRQDPSLLHYRGLIRECGFHRAIEIAARDVDHLREELGRKLDRQAAIRMGFLALGVALGIFLCTIKGCSTIGHEKVAGWPALRVIEHYVPHAAMRDKCAPAGSWMGPVEACALFLLDKGECHIFYSADFPPQNWIVEHERLHCSGVDHVGSQNMRDLLARWSNR